MSKIKEIYLNHHAFTKMYNLRFLQLYGSKEKNMVYGFEGIESNFRELRYFSFDKYPDNSLPSNFNFKNLVHLHLHGSNIKQLCLGKEILDNLKYLDLSESKHLLKISDLSLAQNLKALHLEGCENLHEISLTNIQGSKYLEYLNLNKCSKIKMFPEVSCKIKQLYLNGTGISEVPLSIECLSHLQVLSLEDCLMLRSLPSNMRKLKSLEELRLTRCSNLMMVPQMPYTLKYLCLAGTAIRELPNGICKLKSLMHLQVSSCSHLNRLPEQLGNLEALKWLEADGIREIPLSIAFLKNLLTLSFQRCDVQQLLGFLCLPSVRLQKLSSLDLTGCCITELPNNIGQLSSLKNLNIGQNNFEILPASIKDLRRLESLDLNNCERLKSLPKLPWNLSVIRVEGCTSLEAISDGLSIVRCDLSNFINCFKLNWNAFGDWFDALQNNHLWCKYGFQWMCFPGSEIPKWFTFQSTKSFIKLPPGWANKIDDGFALCAIISSGDDQVHTYVSCYYDLIVDNQSVGRGWFFRFLNDHNYIEGDHVFLRYISYIGFYIDKSWHECYNKETLIKFYFVDKYKESINGYEVKR